MSITAFFLIFFGSLAYYYFVLRKYNSLGFRMFSLFTFITLCFVYWWYSGYKELEDLKKNGIHTEATVIKKSIEGKPDSNVPDNVVTVGYVTKEGKAITAEAREMTSKEEYDEVSVGQKVQIIYTNNVKNTQLQTTFNRSVKDYNWILIMPALFFLIGMGCLVFLGRFKIHAHEGTVYEYLTDENGKVLFDDKQSATTRTIRKINLLSKMMQAFGK
ncbi:DUF3592 domain-containing protein [Emticicia agri]|uniref:DUF3592 domain-containing protein n=1 Tax=Emticicia agri TaxID=2492393 RepID=A0A4Q5M5C4_9BACT|nr:DUF3592 domain-containing protein [Emticicia agri]RYU97628.1 hypothetical protein EWM59_00460 [Emticicia agri]